VAKNPYTVLGVSENDSSEEIRKKYLSLVRKYHPDRYQDPALKEQAQEKLKEINEAYDTIQRLQGTKSSAGGSASYTGGRWQADDPATGVYAQVQAYIRAGDLAAAESLLASITDRGAQWYYFSGLVAMRRGWYAQAEQYFAQAVRMEPHNPHYASAYEQSRQVHARYQGRGAAYNTGRVMGPGCLDCCQTAICMDCCCEMAGADCIPCC